jgi:hypothetical protein
MYKNSQTANNVFHLTLFNQEVTTGFGPYARPSSGFHFIIDKKKSICHVSGDLNFYKAG